MALQKGSLERLRETADLLATSRRRMEKTTRLLQSSWDLLYLSLVMNRAGEAPEKRDGVNRYVATKTHGNEYK